MKKSEGKQAGRQKQEGKNKGIMMIMINTMTLMVTMTMINQVVA